MSSHLQHLKELLAQATLNEVAKALLLKVIAEADKEFSITEFKLERTEKVKRTIAILLEETIEELEQKRKAVEAQNRELEIESSLERVRSIALSMKEPADMPEVCRVIATELDKLGVKEIRNVQTAIFYESKGTYMNYEYYARHNKTIITETSYTNHKMHRAFANQMLKGKGEFFSTHMSKAELPDWIAYQKTTNVFIDTYIETATSLNYYWYSLGPVALGISTYVALNEESINLFKRFLNVFELAYTRFLDIEQAIAQAKEAKIEAALEKVRSRSMGMQKSEELKEVIQVVYEQFVHLNIHVEHAGFIMDYKERDDMHIWLADKHEVPSEVTFPYFNSPHWNSFVEAKEKGIEFFANHLTFEEKNKFYQDLFNLFPVPEEAKEYYFNCPGLAISTVLLENVGLYIENFSGTPYSDEENNTLMRFGKVFQQTYTRFLDLQKAEAQAKEAKIEAALERVRSRSLAVHKSDEFNEVIKVVFERLQELKISMTSVSINVIIEGSKDTEAYICGPGQDSLTLSHIRLIYFDHPIANDRYDAYKKGLEFFTNTYNAEEKNSFYAYEFEVSDLKYIPADIKKMVMESERYTCSVALTKNSMIVVNDFEGKSLSLKEIDILKRFSKVFEQAYVRFLDLQKAEAQAREATIEVALERVRSRSMAMHKSDEVMDVAVTVYDQLQKLDFKFGAATIIIMDEKTGNMEHWLAGFIQKDHVESYEVNNIEHPLHAAQLAAWREGTKFVSIELSGSVLKSYAEEMFTQSGYKNLPDEEKAMLSAQEHAVFNLAYMSHGALMWAPSAISDENAIILQRFAKVFEQTYTRFLDLQKAEAQAREAKIEAALERVRSRTMAMHKSSELAEAAQLLYEEFKTLNINTFLCGYCFIKVEQDKQTVWVTLPDGTLIPDFTDFPLEGDYVLNKRYEDWKQKKPLHVLELEGEVNKEFHRFLASKVADQTVNEIFSQMPDRVIFYCANFSTGYLFIIATESLTREEEEVIIRFAKVFEQTYTRFLDLQKAEAQAREAQIEAALEKIRSRSLAMHGSDELKEVIAIMFEKLNELNILLGTVAIWLFNKATKDSIFWVGNNLQQPSLINLPYDEELMKENTNYKDSWQAFLSGESYINKEYSEEEKNRYFRYVFAHNDLTAIPPEARDFLTKGQKYIACLLVEQNSSLYFDCWNGQLYGEEQINVLKRVAKVFEQAYIRFLDLQKAETQAREAQIEAALERIRSSAMAMHSSDGILEVTHVLREQIALLGEKELESILVHIYYEDKDQFEAWYSYRHPDSSNAEIVHGKQILDWSKTERARKDKEKYHEKESDYTIVADHKMLKEWYEYLYKLVPEVVELNNKGEILVPEVLYYNYSKISGGALLLITNNEPSQESKYLLKRAAKVFTLAYSRFLDLQKAEAQAREAQIQLALERVRARTMAMQRSNELQDAAILLFQQLKNLGVHTGSCGFNIWDKEEKTATAWMSSAEGGLQAPFKLPHTESEIYQQAFKAMKNGEDFLVKEVAGEALKKHFDYLLTLPVIGDVIKNLRDTDYAFPVKMIYHFVYFNQGYLTFHTQEPVPEVHEIFKRFGKVFEQTYTRFLDLQKAEAQAREAKIEAALERVRSRTMAMHKSDELQEVSKIIIQQIVFLNFPLFGFGIHICHENEPVSKAWIGDPTKGPVPTVLYEHTHDSLSKLMYQGWKEGESLLVKKVQGEELKEHFEYMVSIIPISSIFETATPPEFIIYHFAYFSHGFFVIAMLSPYEEAQTILKRFAKVFEQTYTRFLDLQKAEAQAKESQIEAALERVRSRTLAMQKSNELAETAAVLFKQLINLGIEPNRLYINIVKDETGEAEFWITDEDGSKVSMAYEDNLYNNPSFKKMFEGWKQQKKSLVIDMKGKELQQYFKYLNSIHVPFKGGLAQKRRLQYIAYFSKGFIGMASPDEQPAETLQLLERFAYVFNLTFTRFNDLQIAESHAVQAEQDLKAIKAAKQKAEDALNELQLTQKQLVQSEKMASLGELTAGIAHEIQNPLNFVNNFSEVSNELIDEINEEMEKGNSEEVKVILNNIKQNLEKINHHGKRADAIVKGMLQHSRQSKDVKELTDINALCDEYIRLCFHGLRAKDKSFNSNIVTDFDSTIQKINVIPQDIGRVVLNVLTNAFYAVNEKQKAESLKQKNNYQPTVSVQTKKLNDKVEITIKDNGNGIPQNIVDKIFQPFFTTKPTGQGTGLGLSLSYDIVKAHGGEIKVETKEGEGTTFIIQLPETK